MHRREFISTLGQAGLLATGTIAATHSVRAAGSKPRIRVGQIGTGHAHADGKLATLRRSPDYEVVGVVESDERLRRTAAQRKDYQGLPWLTEEQLLNTKGLQAVVVETEVKDLLSVGAHCVAAGAHLHLDKPAGESLPQFRRLLDDATRQGLTVQMGYMFRYNPAFELCFRAVREGWLGKLFSIESVMSKAVPLAERNKLLPYRGGMMFELGCHLIDATLTMLGKPDKVTTHGRHSGQYQDDFLDNQLAVLEYPGVIVNLRSTLLEVEGKVRRQFVVCGDGGTADIQPLEPGALRLALAQPRGGFKTGYQNVTFPDPPHYQAQLADFAQCVRGEKKPAWTPAHDLAVQETVLLASGLPVT